MLRHRIVTLAVSSILLVSSITLGDALADSPPTVEVAVQQGTLEGTRDTAKNGRVFYAFKGIPYAAPPVGELRFKDPAPPASWTSTRKSEKPPVCPQPDFNMHFEGKPKFTGSEDCLYLNVFTPKPYTADLPVMVYIHGGGFLLGDAFVFGGHPKLLLKKDVVLVSIHYRLGTLGFMSTGDSVLPGNLGLKDQSFALKWIQENIQQFGGNPKRVTIFGQSAGAASPHLQIMSPHSTGLFQQAILQSGSALCPWAVRDDHPQIMLEGAKRLGCPGTDQIPPDSAQIFQCLKGKSVEDLVMMALPPSNVMIFPFYMTPRVDGDFLPAHPAQLLRDGRYQKVNLMAGLCQNEGANTLFPILHNNTAAETLIKDQGQLAKIIIGMDHEDNFEYLLKKGFYHYVGGINFNEDKAEEIEQFFAQYTIAVPVDLSVAIHARDLLYGKHTYRYELQHRAEFSFIDPYPPISEVTGKWVAHADDEFYIFNRVAGLINLDRVDDVFLSDIMVTLWTNFARTGNPTPDRELGFKWEPMSSEYDMRYLSLTPAPEMKNDNRHEGREFWKNMPTRTSKWLFPEKFRSGKNSC